MDENKMEAITEQAKEMVEKAVNGFSNKQKGVLAACAVVDGVAFIAAWEVAKWVAPKAKNLVKKIFTKKEKVEVVVPETVEE